MTDRQFLSCLVILVLMFFIWSAIYPHDYFTWLLEVMPVIMVAPVLYFTYEQFKLTRLLYVLIAFHAIVLLIGGHYTYAEMPVFNWLRDYFGWDRNYYDRLGHVMQGVVPAIAAREILLRRQILPRGSWLFFIVVCICLAISAFYEFLEWWVAIVSGSDAVAFLATQGDIWDTQWDMFLAFCGAITAQLCLSKCHDRQLARF